LSNTRLATLSDRVPFFTARHSMISSALCMLEQAPEALTRVPRLGKPSTDREGTSSLARASETYIPREDINFRVSDPSPSRAPGSYPVLITPDERAEVLPSNAREAKKSTKDPFSYKQIKSELIPADLMHCAEEIIEWWAVKKGTRSERVANRVFDKLRNFSQKDRIESLNAAASGAWADIYEPKPNAPKGRPQQKTESASERAARITKEIEAGTFWK